MHMFTWCVLHASHALKVNRCVFKVMIDVPECTDRSVAVRCFIISIIALTCVAS